MINKVSSIYTMIEGRRKTLGFIFTIFGFFFWLIVISTYRVWWVPPSNTFGLYQAVPVWFWLGIILLICGMLFTIDLSSRLQFCFQFILLNLMVWVTPVFIEPNARVTDTWIHFGRTQLIMDTGHIPSASALRYFEYFNWPGSFIFNAMNLQVIGIEFTTYLKFYPLISSTIFIFGYYLLVRRIVKNKTVGRFALLLEIPLNVWLQFHFSPQSYALMLFPLIMLGFQKTCIRWWLVTGVLCTALILSHPTTSIFLGSILLFTFMVSLSYNRALKTNKKRIFLQGIILLIIFIGTTIMFILSGLLNEITTSILNNISYLPSLLLGILENRTSKTPSLFRLIIFIVFGILSLNSIFFIRKNKTLLKFSLGWILGIASVFLIDVTLPGAHFHNRALFYLYLIFPLLCSILVFQLPLFKKIKKVMIAILIVLCLLNFLTIFYTENEAIISDSNLSAVDFVYTHTDDEQINAEQAAVIRAYNADRDIRSLTRSGEIPEGSILIFDDYALISDIVGPRTNSRYEYFSTANNTDLVYSSGTFEIYFYNISD